MKRIVFSCFFLLFDIAITITITGRLHKNAIFLYMLYKNKLQYICLDTFTFL